MTETSDMDFLAKIFREEEPTDNAMRTLCQDLATALEEDEEIWAGISEKTTHMVSLMAIIESLYAPTFWRAKPQPEDTITPTSALQGSAIPAKRKQHVPIPIGTGLEAHDFMKFGHPNTLARTVPMTSYFAKIARAMPEAFVRVIVHLRRKYTRRLNVWKSGERELDNGKLLAPQAMRLKPPVYELIVSLLDKCEAVVNGFIQDKTEKGDKGEDAQAQFDTEPIIRVEET